MADDLRKRYKRRDYTFTPASPPGRPLNPYIHRPGLSAASAKRTGKISQTPQADPMLLSGAARDKYPIADHTPVPNNSPERHIKAPELLQAPARSQPPVTAKLQSRALKNVQKQYQKESPRQNRSRQGISRRKAFFITLILLVVAALGPIGLYGYSHLKILDIPQSYARTLGFPIYYPVGLPDSYYVDNSSFSTHGEALVFNIRSRTDTKKTVSVSEQVLPADFNPDKQLPDAGNQTSDTRSSYTTQAGKGEVGELQGKQVATLATPKTWIIMNVTAIPAGDIAGIASSFERIQPIGHLPVKHWYFVKNP